MAEQQYVVIGHRHEGDVYRLTIARQEVQEVTLTSDKGAVVFNGEGEVATAKQAVTVSEEDFLFAAEDEKWKGLSDKKIADQQRELALKQIKARERAANKAQAEAASHKELPGIGDSL
jgi:hypothetical protein